MAGEIAEGVLPELLRGLYVGRRSGLLRLRRGDEEQSLRFRHGTIVNAQTNVVEDRLGEMLVRRGLLGQADLVRSTEIVMREKRRLGAVLSDLGLIDTNGLEDAIAFHVHEMLARLFTWPDGSYAFEPETQETSDAGDHAQAVDGRADPRGRPRGEGPRRRALRARRDRPRARAVERSLAALPEADALAGRRLRALAHRRHHHRARDPADDPAAGRGDPEEPVRPALDGRHRARREAQARHGGAPRAGRRVRAAAACGRARDGSRSCSPTATRAAGEAPARPAPALAAAPSRHHRARRRLRSLPRPRLPRRPRTRRPRSAARRSSTPGRASRRETTSSFSA